MNLEGRQAVCDGKRQLGDFPSARDFATLCSRNTGARMQPYRCRHCRFWHIGEHIGPKHLKRRPARRSQDLEKP
jgi:hypothetical protein